MTTNKFKGIEKMKLYELFDCEIQSEHKVVFYDFENNLRVDVADGWFLDRRVQYLYVDHGVLYIEIESPLGD